MAEMRPSASDANDEQYKIPLTALYITLSPENRQEIVKCIHKDLCKSLANALLDEEEMIAALNRQDIPYPASEIIEQWSRKPRSTIWILEETFKKLHLDNALKKLDEARYDYLTIYVLIYKSGSEWHKQLFKKVPAKKPFVEVFRPHFHRKHGLATVQRGTIQVLRLMRFDQELTWSSPAKNFKGQQIDINIELKKLNEVERHTDPGRQLEDRSQVGRRNVISWIENDSLFFEYDDVDTTISQESLEAGQSIGRPIEESGIVDPSNEDTLWEHLTNDGDFVVQQIQTEGRKTLNLNVRHGGQILKYPIIQKDEDGKECFSISGVGYSSTDADQLVNYYQAGRHHLPRLPSLPPTQAEDDSMVCLMKNVSISKDN